MGGLFEISKLTGRETGQNQIHLLQDTSRKKTPSSVHALCSTQSNFSLCRPTRGVTLLLVFVVFLEVLFVVYRGQVVDLCHNYHVLDRFGHLRKKTRSNSSMY